MKKIVCAMFMAIIFVVGGIYIFNPPKFKHEYVRIHIRANSNSDIDQLVKYKIKDRVVEYLTPLMVDCQNKSEFENIIRDNLNNISDLSTSILISNGFSYSARAKLTEENFPTRSYDGVILEEGIYDALILELGDAKGDNWWCVVYPPLCFLNNNSSNVEYRSKIAEIIEKVLG